MTARGGAKKQADADILHDAEGVTKCLIWSGEPNEDDAVLFPNRLRKTYAAGAPPHMEQHFFICDATAPALVQFPKQPVEPITVESIQKSRMLWPWLRREAALNHLAEVKMSKERDHRHAVRERLGEYHRVQMLPLCRTRDHLPPPVNHFRAAAARNDEAPSHECQHHTRPPMSTSSPRAVASARVCRQGGAFFAAPPNASTSHHHPPTRRPLSSTVKRRIVEIADRFGT